MFLSSMIFRMWWVRVLMVLFGMLLYLPRHLLASDFYYMASLAACLMTSRDSGLRQNCSILTSIAYVLLVERY